MFQVSFSHASFRSKENGKSFGWDWKIVWPRTFYCFPQWKKAERYTFYLSSRNMLYDSLLSYNLKDETSFSKIPGGDAVQRSKGQSFLSLQTNKNLCLIKESLRFLRWPIRLVSRLNPKKEENPLKVIDFQGIWIVVAVRTGLEPVTPCVTGMYSNQLN